MVSGNGFCPARPAAGPALTGHLTLNRWLLLQFSLIRAAGYQRPRVPPGTSGLREMPASGRPDLLPMPRTDQVMAAFPTIRPSLQASPASLPAAATAASRAQRAPDHSVRCAGRRPTKPGSRDREKHASRIWSSRPQCQSRPSGHCSAACCDRCRAWPRDAGLPARSFRRVRCHRPRPWSRASETMHEKRRSTRRKPDTGST